MRCTAQQAPGTRTMMTELPKPRLAGSASSLDQICTSGTMQASALLQLGGGLVD